MRLDIGPESGSLRLVGEPVQLPTGWKVRARKPGDRIRLLPEGPSYKIKQFFRSAIIPPWLRAGIPVLEWDGELVALGDWVIGHRLQNWLVQNDLKFQWRPSDPVLGRVRSDSQR
jgi:tRNA(Ile)-lysidine synthetase-like protein